MNVYEMYGRLAETKSQMDDFARTTLDLLRRIQSGEVDPSRLVISESSWTLKGDHED